MAKPAKDKTSSFDFKWLILAGLLIVVLIIAIALSINRTSDTSDKVASTIETDNGDTKINWELYPTYDMNLNGPVVLAESATYHLTGYIDDGSVTIKAGDGVIRLILDNVYIVNSSGPAIACYSAEDLVIELEGENYIEDGSTYSGDIDADVTGAIYSKADLSFGGDGTLKIVANLADGIISKDDLKFNSGTYNINAKDDAIRGTDSVNIIDGTFTINSGGDAIKSTNELEAGKGFVLIESGNFNIVAAAKGIKAINNILIYGGNFVFSTTDDAIHTNNHIGIIGGSFDITSGDDGIHADNELIIDDGTINIIKGYEGLEAQKITINNGNISVIANDDGINAGGGADNYSQNRPGANNFNTDTACEITINGGNIYINSSGDGLDSNGYIYFNGGTVTVDGPTNSGNGALDAEYGMFMNGGALFAVGSSGMATAPSNSSSVYSASIYLSTTEKAITKIEIKNSNNETIISHTSAKSFSHIAVGTIQFLPGETYNIYLDGTLYDSFTISSTVTTVGNSNMNFQNGAGNAGNPNGAGGPTSPPGDRQ